MPLKSILCELQVEEIKSRVKILAHFLQRLSVISPFHYVNALFHFSRCSRQASIWVMRCTLDTFRRDISHFLNDNQFANGQQLMVISIHCAIFYAIFLVPKSMEKLSPDIHRCRSINGEEMSTFIDWNLNHSNSLVIYCHFDYFLYGIRFDRSLNGWLRFQLHMCCNSLSLFYCQSAQQDFFRLLMRSGSVRYEVLSNH